MIAGKCAKDEVLQRVRNYSKSVIHCSAKQLEEHKDKWNKKIENMKFYWKTPVKPIINLN